MPSLRQTLQSKEWRREHYLISTDLSLIPLEKVNEAFASDRLYWAKPVPSIEDMREMLENSLCFAIYDTAQKPTRSNANWPVSGTPDYKLVGFGRCITDFVTFVYLTDVYVDHDQQGAGLGKWLLSCVKETTDAMPYLRRTLLFTSDWKRSVPFYQQHLGMNVMQGKSDNDKTESQGLAIMESMGKGHPLYTDQ